MIKELNMTPRCQDVSSIKSKTQRFEFSETQTYEPMLNLDTQPKAQEKINSTNIGTANLMRGRLIERVKENLGELMDEVCPNVLIRANLERNLRFFFSNLTNDLILHMILTNYKLKNQRMDEEGDGIAHQEVVDLLIDNNIILVI